MKRAIACATMLALLGANRAQGYELATHATLTWHAYQRSILGQDTELWKSLGADQTKENPFGSVYFDVTDSQVQERSVADFEKTIIEIGLVNLGAKHLTTSGWLLRGAIREDDYTGPDAPNPKDRKNRDTKTGTDLFSQKPKTEKPGQKNRDRFIFRRKTGTDLFSGCTCNRSNMRGLA